MLASPWLRLRQAKDALTAGRPEDAHQLLQPLLNEGQRRAVKLAREVMRAYVAGGEKAIRADDRETAWQKLTAAESLDSGGASTASLRQSLVRLALAECRAALEAGNPLHVIELVERLRGRRAFHPDFDALETAAQEWVLAQEMADRGDFLLAAGTAERVRPRLANVPLCGLQRFQESLQTRHEIYRTAAAELSDAVEARDWPRAADTAAKVVAVAPTHREARNAQFRAWDRVQPLTALYTPEAEIVPLLASPAEAKASTAALKRFLLWIDGVGGYLVCLGPRVSFGQAMADAPIDIPLLADVSRLHAEISRDGEGYMLESSRGALVNSAPITRAVLKPADRVTLGNTCQFVFHQPSEISPTARLELVSGHRLQIAVDGVLLMAETLILGPAGQAHIVVPWLCDTIVLYRSKEGIGVRIPGEFRVDAKRELNRAALPLPSVVSSEKLHFAVEPVGPRF